MKRLLLGCTTAAAAMFGSVAPIGAAAMTASSPPPPPPRASLEGLVCRRAPTSLNRAIAVTGVMRPVTATWRMAMKFELEQKRAGSRSFSFVRGGDLGRWRYPTNPPTLGQRPDDVWKLNKEVVNLAAPAVYRFRVTFRWTGHSGQVLARAIWLSSRCDQPG